MNVVSKEQIPTSPPPRTYDITDLTQDQVDWLISLLGKVSASDAEEVFSPTGWGGEGSLYYKLRRAGAHNTFDVSGSVDDVIKVTRRT